MDHRASSPNWFGIHHHCTVVPHPIEVLGIRVEAGARRATPATEKKLWHEGQECTRVLLQCLATPTGPQETVAQHVPPSVWLRIYMAASHGRILVNYCDAIGLRRQVAIGVFIREKLS